MLFIDIIEGLEATSQKMLAAARQQAWDDMGQLDHQRVDLLAALETAEEHILDDHLRDCIANIMALDNTVIDLIRDAKNRAHSRAMATANTDTALEMYSGAP